jgi:hypothetical protein
MPISSYIAYPQVGKRSALIDDLANRPEVSIIPSDNRDILVLVTETRDSDHEDELRAFLQGLDSLMMLAMASGFADDART